MFQQAPWMTKQSTEYSPEVSLTSRQSAQRSSGFSLPPLLRVRIDLDERICPFLFMLLDAIKKVCINVVALMS